jgi:DedD protein
MPQAKPAELSQAELELKRRGRRRLIGAITLGLIALVVLPMIFDSEPKKQLATKQEISIAIPPKEGLPPLPPPVAAPAVPPTTSVPSTQAVPTPPAQVAPPAVVPPAVAKVEPKAEPKVEPKAPPKVEAKTEPKVEPKAAPAKAADASGKFVIQLGAFKDAENAKGIVKQMKDAKLPVFTDTIAVKSGNVTRVRVGPYASRAKAEGALAEVKLAGGEGKVVPLQ